MSSASLADVAAARQLSPVMVAVASFCPFVDSSTQTRAVVLNVAVPAHVCYADAAEQKDVRESCQLQRWNRTEPFAGLQVHHVLTFF